MSVAALDFARAADPVQVFKEGVRDAEGQLTVPARWQEDVVRSTKRRHLILVSRQGGKSTTVGAKCAHGMIYSPGLYLIICPSLRQSKLFFKKVSSVYRNLKNVPRITRSTETEMELENGSQLVALPGDDDANIRGYSAPRLIVVDEASRVIDKVYAALRPMLAASSTGQFIALTTPYGRRGWFFEAYETGGDAWERTKVTAFECAHYAPGHLDDERDQMSDWRFRAEYLCEFVDDNEAFFSSELIDAMVDNNIEVWA